MYLALRGTGNLIWPILLHATTDPTIFLSNTYPSEGALAAVSLQGTFVIILAGLVLLFFIRGRVGKEVYGVPSGAFGDGAARATAQK